MVYTGMGQIVSESRIHTTDGEKEVRAACLFWCCMCKDTQRNTQIIHRQWGSEDERVGSREGRGQMTWRRVTDFFERQ